MEYRVILNNKHFLHYVHFLRGVQIGAGTVHSYVLYGCTSVIIGHTYCYRTGLRDYKFSVLVSVNPYSVFPIKYKQTRMVGVYVQMACYVIGFSMVIKDY